MVEREFGKIVGECDLDSIDEIGLQTAIGDLKRNALPLVKNDGDMLDKVNRYVDRGALMADLYGK